MHDDAPYRSPDTLGHQLTPPLSSTSRSGIVTLAFLVLPVFGGIAGFMGYIFVANILEKRDTTTEPILSYGQQAGLISLPMCTLICTAIGLGLAFTFFRQYGTAIVILLLAPLSGWAINYPFWNDQFRAHGPDPSEAVLYYAPLACSGIAVSTAFIVAVWALLTHRRKVTQPSHPRESRIIRFYHGASLAATEVMYTVMHQDYDQRYVCEFTKATSRRIQCRSSRIDHRARTFNTRR